MKLYYAASVFCVLTISHCVVGSGRAGVWKVIDENSQKAHNLSEYAVQTKDSELGSSHYQSKTINVTEAYGKKVESGMMYKLVLSVSGSNCTTNSTGDCTVQHVYNCTVQVLENASANNQSLELFNCTSAPTEQSTTPAPEDDQNHGGNILNKDDPVVVSLTKKIAVQLNARSNTNYYTMVKQVVNVTAVVVAGVQYTFVIEIVQTTCFKTPAPANPTFEDCPAISGEIPTICTVELWVQQWLRKEVMTTQNCV